MMILLFTFSVTLLTAQVRTTILGKEQSISTLMPGYTEDQPTAKILPKVDVRKVLEEDLKKDEKVSRYGIKIPTQITELDGQWYEDKYQSIWKIRFYSHRATSLSFQFENLFLPVNSEMWLYSEAQNMIQGPILPEYVHDGNLPTDIIYGEDVTVMVSMPPQAKDSFNIEVENVIHGIKKGKLGVREYGESKDCNVDVVCSPEGDDWQKAKDAVCFILYDGYEFGTGALINNVCNDLTPYIYTARHLAQPYYSNLESENFIFRFRYESPSCDGPEPISWISFFGADLLIWHESSDGALFEMYEEHILNYPELVFAGWNRDENVVLDSSIIIHHPEGDVKKITKDAEPATSGNLPRTCPLDENFKITLTPGANGDYGVLEHASSGAPLFDSNRKIVGVPWGGYLGNCNDTIEIWLGKFSQSWNDGYFFQYLEGATSGSSTPMTTESIRVPHINGSHSGCYGNTDLYAIQNPIPGKNTSWKVEPPTAAVSSSGSGTSANITWSNDFDGYAKVTFTQSESSCDNVEITKNVRIGTPRSISESWDPVSHSYVANPSINKQYEFHANTPYNSSSSSDYSWTVTPPSGSGFPTFHSGKEFTYTATVPGTYTFELKINGYCGWSSVAQKTVTFPSSSSLKSTNWEIFPNPVNNSISVTYSINDLKTADQPAVLEIYSSTGKLVYKEENYRSGQSIHVNKLRTGIYKIIIQNGNKNYYESFFKN